MGRGACGEGVVIVVAAAGAVWGQVAAVGGTVYRIQARRPGGECSLVVMSRRPVTIIGPIYRLPLSFHPAWCGRYRTNVRVLPAMCGTNAVQNRRNSIRPRNTEHRLTQAVSTHKGPITARRVVRRQRQKAALCRVVCPARQRVPAGRCRKWRCVVGASAVCWVVIVQAPGYLVYGRNMGTEEYT